MRYTIPFTLLLLLLLSGCAGQPPARDLPPLRDVLLKDYEEQLGNNNPVRALETVDQLLRRELIDSAEHAIYRGQIADLNTELYTASIENEEWSRALTYQKTARLANLSFPENHASRAELITLKLKEQLDAGNRIAAYAEARNDLRDGYLVPAEIEFLIEDAQENGYEGYARQLSGRSLDDSFSLRKDLPGIVDSTVTIWVNRGMRIESGMGYPDRVIGSGFFIDYRGYILTNYHVIESEVDPEYEGFSRLFIRRGGSSSGKIPARVVGWDPLLDIALLKVELTPEYIFTPGSTRLSLGEPIYAIGSPGGLEKTITSGIVSASDRRLLQIGDAVQIDVPINSGNSGGPLLNENGLLVGVVFAGIEIFEGINFAIPMYWLERVIPALYQEGAVAHAWIGAALHEDQNGLTNLYSVPGSPAGRSGIAEGDQLLSVDGQPVGSLRQVHALLVGDNPGELIQTIWRNREGKEKTVFMELQKRPRSPILEAYRRDAEKELILPLFGMKIEETGSTLWEKGFIITEVYPGTVADETGLSVNDPFYWRGFKIDEENKVAFLQMIIKKRKAGFLESSIQLGAYIEVDYFI